jgi:hypothetical protein
MSLFLAAALIMSANIMAQDAEPMTAMDKPTKIGVGAHLGWPTLLGPSVKAWLSPRIGVQGMGSFFSVDDASLTMLNGRVLFRLSEADKKVAPYIGAGAGVWIASEDDEYYDWESGRIIKEDDSESVATFEFILGFQHSWSTNLAGDYELGYYSVNFDDVDVSISGMALSFAVHYFF